MGFHELSHTLHLLGEALRLEHCKWYWDISRGDTSVCVLNLAPSTTWTCWNSADSSHLQHLGDAGRQEVSFQELWFYFYHCGVWSSSHRPCVLRETKKTLLASASLKFFIRRQESVQITEHKRPHGVNPVSMSSAASQLWSILMKALMKWTQICCA